MHFRDTFTSCASPISRPGKNHLTLARWLAILRAMRHVVRTVAAIRFALSTRRDLLLEILALRHQLGVLARSNRRFRASDRLLWLMLATDVASVERRAGAGPAGHRRPLASRWVPSMLAPSLATSWTDHASIHNAEL